MRRRRKLNNMRIAFIIVLLLGIGFAYLTTTLTINGTTNFHSNTWNVYWDNVQVTTGSVTANTPVIDTAKTTVTFSVHLSKPGDFYEFTVDAKNDGTIDAMIDEITKTTNIPNYLNYTVTYDNDTAIEENQLLNANSVETYKVRVEYRTDINANQLPSTAETTNLTFGVTYVQATSTAQEEQVDINSLTYTIAENELDQYIYLGSPIPNTVTTFDNIDSAFNSTQKQGIILGHDVQNGIVEKSYVLVRYNDEIICLKGGADNYDYNKSLLFNVIGHDLCSESQFFSSCSYDEYYLSISPNGNVTAVYMGEGCWIDDDYSYCY